MAEQLTSCLYRPQIYQAELHREHISFLKQGFNSYLTISNLNNNLYYPALLTQRAEDKIIAELNNKERKSHYEHLFLLVSLKLSGRSYHAELSDFKRDFPTINHSQQIDKYVEYFSKIPPFVVPNTNKQSIRWQYEKLIGKANSEGYFTIPDVPVFLISTKWLEQLYSPNNVSPSPINNQTLLEPTQFPLAEQKHLHYNYRVREDLRENEDYKLVSYQAWQHLYKIYGGFEIRRFTTKQREPIVEIWHIKVSILIVEERCVFHHLQLQVAKGESFSQLIERLQLTLRKYKIVPEKYLARTIGLYKSKEMAVKQVASVLQDDSHPFIISHRFEKITDLSVEMEEAGILSPHDVIILNLGSDKGIYSKIQPLKILSVRERCLNCGSSEALQPCKCRSVFFCSSKCKDSQKAHQKQCDSLVSETRKFNLVVEYYQVKRRSYPDLKRLNEIGKVGFENLGNTCYMNSSLQCLIRITDLAQYFLTNGHLNDLNVGNVLGSEGQIACAFGQLIKNYYTTSKRALQPTDILRCIAKNPQFRGFNHQDSQEFLNYFLDKLHEDLNKVKVKPYIEDVESNGRPDEIVSRISWENYKKRNDSFISDLLAGQYRSQIKCPDCNRVSITFDPFLSATLQFPKPQKGETIKGYYMNEEGEFQKVEVQAKASMPTYEFYDKYFHHPVRGVYLKDKRLADVWDKNKSIFQNRRSSGLLFFFEQPQGHHIEVSIEIYNTGKESLDFYTRIAFAKELATEEDLSKLVLLAVRRPFQKVLQKDLTQSEYLSLCIEKGLISFRSISENEGQVQFPVLGASKLKVKVELLYHKITNNAPKLNIAPGSYQGKVQSLVKKLKGELSVRQLLQCFSEPQKLTEDNAWYCSVCKGHKLADKAMSLYSLPKYLIVHLKRFNHRGDSGNRYIIYGQKVTTPIALEEYQEFAGQKYELIGVVNHFGSLMHGHYTACVKRDDWHNYDDSRCFRSKLDGKNAYLLFYKHVQ